jgi:hypothetical protein
MSGFRADRGEVSGLGGCVRSVLERARHPAQTPGLLGPHDGVLHMFELLAAVSWAVLVLTAGHEMKRRYG